MADPHVITALVKRRSELSGDIETTQKKLQQMIVDLEHLDQTLLMFDPDYRGTISAKTQSMNVDYSAFEGWKLEGRTRDVTVRGSVAVRDGKFVGTPGRGKFLQRTPSHF